MVCKEEVITWFKDLDSYKRIDVLCELLNMLVPFELRFLGSCVEELGKHTYQELRTQASFANDLEKLSNDVMFKNQSLFEETVRHRVLLNLSLLKSRNYCVANWYSKMFLRTDYIQDLISKEHDDIVQSELLLLFTMASRHPAFSFEQRDFFSTILLQLCKLQKERLSSKAPNTFGYPPGFGYPSVQQRKNMHEAATATGATIPPASFAIHPPGISGPHVEYVTPLRTWPGPPFGAPELPPFPQPLQPPRPPASPLASRGGSPAQSRGSSPHRAAVRPPPLPLLGHPGVDVVAVRAASLADAMQAPPLPPRRSSQQFVPEVVRDVEPVDPKISSGLMEDSKVQQPWILQQGTEVKPPNGVRFPFTAVSKLRPSLNDQIQALSLNDNDNIPYQSNSSSNSSPRVSPPSTPGAVVPHGPGRGPPLANGGPPQPPTFLPLPPFGAADAAAGGSPPPPQGSVGPPFSACTVPYTYQSFTAMPPNRPMFPYTTATFRPTFTAHYAFPAAAAAAAGDSTSFPTYALPYFSLMYSSYPPPMAPPPSPRRRGRRPAATTAARRRTSATRAPSRPSTTSSRRRRTRCGTRTRRRAPTGRTLPTSSGDAARATGRGRRRGSSRDG